jgi:hypothetical protein
VPWDVEYTDEFLKWWNEISGREQDSVSISVDRLIEDGISLGFPHSSAIHSSRHSHMRELRVRGGRSSIRVFYAFDPRRTSILLVGGFKTDGERFYQQYVPIADRLYDQYLEDLRQEGLIP